MTTYKTLEKNGNFAFIKRSDGNYTIDYFYLGEWITAFSSESYDRMTALYNHIINLKMIILGAKSKMNESIQIAIMDKPIYHNDLTCKLWCFDFKHGNVWVENIEWNNDLTEVKFTITESRS